MVSPFILFVLSPEVLCIFSLIARDLSLEFLPIYLVGPCQHEVVAKIEVEIADVVNRGYIVRFN